MEALVDKSGKLLTKNQGYVDAYGYHVVNIQGKAWKVHRLVLSTFKPVTEWETLDVNHINGIKLDNRVENLEWMTRSANTKHANEVLKVYRGSPGALNARAKLTDHETMLAQIKIFKGESLSAIARLFGVSPQAIYYIKKRFWHVHNNIIKTGASA